MKQVFNSKDLIRLYYELMPDGHFFDDGTLRFFGSRIGWRVYSNNTFVTSERTGFSHSSPRGYTVRRLTENGNIESLSEFNEFTSRDSAHRAAKRMAKQ